MNEKIKLDLVRKNDKLNALYTERVRKAVDKEFKLADEVAILRKSMAYLFELISHLHEGEIDNEEFAKYHLEIEKIKSEIKTDLGIN